ncbi:MAG: hypothetical protein PHW93_03465 [Candidatus Methanomethylophilaceae archaeon]|nr:hypothetical protein [Candidatus Methanomethylophilaceae archaeon]
MIFRRSFFWKFLSRIWSFYKNRAQHEAIWQIVRHIAYGFYLRLGAILRSRSITRAPGGLPNTFLNSKVELYGIKSGITIDSKNILSVPFFWETVPDVKKDLSIYLSLVGGKEEYQIIPKTYYSIQDYSEIFYDSFFDLLKVNILTKNDGAFEEMKFDDFESSEWFLSEGSRQEELFLLGKGCRTFFLAEYSDGGPFYIPEDDRRRDRDVDFWVGGLIFDDQYIALMEKKSEASAYKVEVFSMAIGSSEQYSFDLDYSVSFPFLYSDMWLYFIDDDNDLCFSRVYSLRFFPTSKQKVSAGLTAPVKDVFLRSNFLFVVRESAVASVQIYDLSVGDMPVLVSSSNFFVAPVEIKYGVIESFHRNDQFVAIIWKQQDKRACSLYYFSGVTTCQSLSSYGLELSEGAFPKKIICFKNDWRFLILCSYEKEGLLFGHYFFEIFEVRNNLTAYRRLVTPEEEMLRQEIPLFFMDSLQLIDDKHIVGFRDRGDPPPKPIFYVIGLNFFRLNSKSISDYGRLGGIPSSNFIGLNEELLEAIQLSADPEDDLGELVTPKDVIMNWRWRLKKEGERYVFKIIDFGYINSKLNFLPLNKRSSLMAGDSFFNSGLFSFGQNGDIIRLFSTGGGTVETQYEGDNLNFFVTLDSLILDDKDEYLENAVYVILQKEKIAEDLLYKIDNEGIEASGIKFYISPTKFKLSFNKPPLPLPTSIPFFASDNFESEKTSVFSFAKFGQFGFYVLRKQKGPFVFPVNEEDIEEITGLSSAVDDRPGFISAASPLLEGFFPVLYRSEQLCIFGESDFYDLNRFSSSVSYSGKLVILNTVCENGVVSVTSTLEPFLFLGSFFERSGEIYFVKEASWHSFKQKKIRLKLVKMISSGGDFSFLEVDDLNFSDGQLMFSSAVSWRTLSGFCFSRLFDSTKDRVFSDVYCVAAAASLNRDSSKQATFSNIENSVYEEIGDVED